jgi:hypothetical protein
MTSRDAIFVIRKAEDRPDQPGRTGDYASPRAQKQKHRQRDLNEKLWEPVPPSHLTAATWKVITLIKGLLAKRAINYLDSHIGKMDNAKQCITN